MTVGWSAAVSVSRTAVSDSSWDHAAADPRPLIRIINEIPPVLISSTVLSRC